jgi:hypothetical protein
MMYQSVSCEDLARLLSSTAEEIRDYYEVAGVSSLGFRRLDRQDRDTACHAVLSRILDETLPRSVESSAERWVKGWDEVRRDFVSSGYDLQMLRPQYFRYKQVRFAGDFVEVSTPAFEYDLYTAMRGFLFRKYLDGISRVVEFGCGTGSTLLLLHSIFPHMELIGTDWAQPSQEILGLISEKKGVPVSGINFDMLHPASSESPSIHSRTAVITMHAMEQLGESFGPFLDFLRAARPALCLHIEPIYEFYDSSSFFDCLAQSYHRRRNYLRGFLPVLEALARRGHAEILQSYRSGLGCVFHEGYSVVVWRPIG